jgi:hypothetical protein
LAQSIPEAHLVVFERNGYTPFIEKAVVPLLSVGEAESFRNGRENGSTELAEVLFSPLFGNKFPPPAPDLWAIFLPVQPPTLEGETTRKQSISKAKWPRFSS